MTCANGGSNQPIKYVQILLTLCSTCQSCFTQKYVMKQELDTLYAPESGLRLTIRLILFLQI